MTEESTMSAQWKEFIERLGASSIAVAAALLTVAAVTHVTLQWWIVRTARRQDPSVSAVRTHSRRRLWWLIRGLRDTLPPIAALIWIHALYGGARVLIADSGMTVATNVVTWTYRLGLITALVWLLHRAGVLIEAFLRTVAARAETSWDDLVLPFVGRMARRTLPMLGVILAAPALSAAPALAQFVGSATSLLLIVTIALVLTEAVEAVASLVRARHRIDVSDNLQARAIHTQVVVLKKVAMTIIGIFSLASMLMVFDSVRQFGASILASAGVAGIIVGLAAQRSLAAVLAGFQIALTQPIRVEDVVIVEHEWGRIEDITLTYVVVRIWDERRLIVPITYFIEQPFQNWTRSSSELLATVFLHGDYTLPVDALRAELTRILRASPYWDGNVNVVQVTDAKEHTMEIRALASARDSSNAWDLRCEVREKLVAFLQQRHPESLPQFRTSPVVPAAASLPTRRERASP